MFQLQSILFVIPNGSSIPGPWVVVSVWFSVLQFVLNASTQTEEQKLAGCRPGNEATGTSIHGQLMTDRVFMTELIT